MECQKCHSKWETDQSRSASLASCPFCGKSLAAAQENQFHDNSRDALRAIAETYGAETLLGEKLKPLFPDLAPSVSQNVKGLVYSVHEKGAAQILRGSLNASRADKEIAVKRAVQKLTDAFVAQTAAETIIFEFAAALGWQCAPPAQSAPPKQEAPKPASAPASAPVPQPKAPQKQPAQTAPTSAQFVGGAPTVGGIVTFGSFGGKTLKWRVLDVQEGRALLLTKAIIEKRPYHSSNTNTTWEKCALRQYLNGDFLANSFGAEKSRIAQVTNANPDNQWFGTAGGNSTPDRVFLLSIGEVVKYFGDSGQLKNRPRKDSWWISDQYNSKRIAKYGNRAWWWWLRSPGNRSHDAAYVGRGGYLRICGYDFLLSGEGGVRPALWLNLQS